MNTKPFDINAARNGAKVVTKKDGYPAKIIMWDLKSCYSVLAIVDYNDGSQYAFQYTDKGHYFNDKGNPMDLMMLTDEQGNYIYD